MKKHAEICPVCKGTGKYKDYTNCNYTATITPVVNWATLTNTSDYTIGDLEVTDDYTPDWGNPPQGTVVFSDSVDDMNKYYQEFCEKRDIKPVEFCDEDNHIPHID